AFPVGNHKEAAPFGAYRVNKLVEFDGEAGNGAAGTVALFTVTGSVFVTVTSFCTESLVESGATATISVGITGITAGLIALLNAVDIDIGEIWFDATPVDMEVLSSLGGAFIGGGEDIFATIAAADVDDGTLEFVCFWTPLSSDGLVVAA
ncbi:unnamed protein product, partial [marine sediment metagenome]